MNRSRLRLLTIVLSGCLLAAGHQAEAQTDHHTIAITHNTTSDTVLKPLLGVISGPLPAVHSPAPDLTPQLQDIGVTSIRNNDYYDDRLDIERIFRCPDTTTYPSWECDPYDPNNYHWSASDTLFQSIVDGGFEPFLRLGGEYECELWPHKAHGPQNATQEDNWIVAAIKTADRYSHWQGQTDVLTYLDIWTEWANRQFWDRSNSEFIRFWMKAFEQIKSAFPDLKVGGPGFLVCTVHVIEGRVEDNDAVDFLRALYEHGLKPDWIGWHLWNNNPEKYYLAARQYRDLLDGVGDFASVPWAGTGFFDGVEIICDAYGLSKFDDSSGEPVPLPTPRMVQMYTHSEGAAILTGQWIAMQLADVERAYYYRAGDPNSDPSNPPNSREAGWSGLFYGNPEGTYKPMAHAFRLWSRMVNTYPRLLSTPFPSVGSSGGKLWVLAGLGGPRIGVLLANTESYAQTYSLTLFGQPVTSDRFEITLYQVDDNNDGQKPLPHAGEEFEIPAGTVQLVTLHPKSSGVERSRTTGLPERCDLLVNTPNPFNNSTILRFRLAQPGPAKLEIFDLSGRRVATVFDGFVNDTWQTRQWDGTDATGKALASGTYVCRLSQNGRTLLTKKLTLLR